MGDSELSLSAFMSDYFAEADDHIVAIRRALLSLEGELGGELSRAALEELFRNFHSLKGISAMVELHEAEILAHHMESCLRAVRQGEVDLDADSFETLLAGANLLEEVVVARRSTGEMPILDTTLAALERLASPTAHKAPIAEIVSPPHGGPLARTWKVSFVPSATLIARGVKVDWVRARLLAVGTILSAAPKVLAGGGICFEFEVRTDDEDSLAALTGDGVSFEPVVAADPGAVPVPASTTVIASSAASRTLELAGAAPANFVRVDLGRLDELMRLLGDLVVTRARVDDTLRRVEALLPAAEFRSLQEYDAQMARQLRDLREGIMRVRLVPVGEIFRRMPFVVRDLARDSGKQVTLEVVGQGTEIDKFLVERMMDPVLHLVRNAISHGIEDPARRLAAGKPADGTIRLAAATAGESVVIEITDDGAGIDGAAVAERARAKGLHGSDGPLDSRALLEILCASGFSTRDAADRASGRGVGMAVVRATVLELGGSLALDTKVGWGTTFTITLPLTLAITDAIIAHVGDQRFAVPQSTVREVIEVDPADVRALERNELITYRGRALPLARLGKLFRIDSRPRPRLHALVVGAGAEAVGLLVDRIAGHREIVVKTFTDPLIRVHGVAGATELGDGRLVLILDPAALGRGLVARRRSSDGMAV